jgi:hypothetical protein
LIAFGNVISLCEITGTDKIRALLGERLTNKQPFIQQLIWEKGGFIASLFVFTYLLAFCSQ